MTRPRGFINWAPQAKTRVLLTQVNEVLDLYRAELPLTCRQIFYRLVAAHEYDKTDAGYERLTEVLVKARRAGSIPFGAIRDDGFTVEQPLEYADPEEFLRIAEDLASRGQGVRLAGQPRWVEVWVEAAGMAPQVARAVSDFGVTVYSSGGFDSLTVKYVAAVRVAGRDVPTVVLHIGDHDPSGLALFEAAAEDVTAFATELSGLPDKVGFERVAVTAEQIERFDLPTKPAKSTDKRSVWCDGDGTVQAEALPPDVLAAEVRLAVEAHLDMDAFDEALRQEDENRAAVDELLQGLRGDQ